MGLRLAAEPSWAYMPLGVGFEREHRQDGAVSCGSWLLALRFLARRIRQQQGQQCSVVKVCVVCVFLSPCRVVHSPLVPQ